jgi:GNAT superfamily N-acetyltransferase
VSTAGDDLVAVRPAEESDEAAILELAAASLGWMPDAVHAEFFRWKHAQNPFGASPRWVAIAGDRVVGFRTFLRWEFETPTGDVVRAVRAVDTATHPEFQGRGVFTRLTLYGLDQLRHEGVDLVFNTPNVQSRPGYLKMGWQVAGRVPVAIRPRSVGALRSIAKARVPAQRWSLPTEAGIPMSELATADLAPLLASQPPAAGLRTRRTLEYLRWRFGFAPLAYRCVLATGDPADGLAVFRLRRRGGATEAAYAISTAGLSLLRAGYVRVPRQGPTLTWRPLCMHELPAAWALSLGDVELF